MPFIFYDPPPYFLFCKIKGKRHWFCINFRKPIGRVQEAAKKPNRCKRITIRKRLANFINRADETQIQKVASFLREQNEIF